jgi:predicted  nucleic acid-binding Zn-ribbon protein
VHLQERISDLEQQVTDLMEENAAMAEEGLSKDEEIEALEGQLAHLKMSLAASQASGTPARTQICKAAHEVMIAPCAAPRQCSSV